MITATFVFANSAQRILYIDQYKDLAISEMHRTGIPASIKLAQAILESNAGQSTLAREANNHFGIKCGSYWNGKTFYRKDDDRNSRGKLIKSCFRAFKTPVESFIEHSDFLSVQNRRRYDFLFSYGASDYTNWAYGLKKAGYATHKEYPQLLIKLIEEYQLYKYDNPGGLEEVVAVNRPTYTKPTVTNTAPKKKKKRNQPNIFDNGSAGEISMDAFKTKVAITKVNKVNVTYATAGDNISDVAMRSGVSVKKLVKYNDNVANRNQLLTSGTQVFLAKKKSSYKGKRRFHYVRAEDNMISISQQYGIQLKSLYAMNAMPLKSEPAIGEKIYLKGKMPKGRKVKTKMLRVGNPKPTFTSIPNSTSVEESVVVPQEQPTETVTEPVTVEPIIVETAPVKETPTTNTGVVITWDDQPRKPVVETTVKEYYTVRKSDTLWSIAQRNGVTVNNIKTLNNLRSNTILIGQNLRIK